MIMDEADENLKNLVRFSRRSAASFADERAAGRPPTGQARRHVLRGRQRRQAGGNPTLTPGARPDEGVLDLYIASPRRLRHWIKLDLRLIARQPKRDDQVDQHSGRRVAIRIDGKANCQLDGDVGGESTTLTAEIQPGALPVCASAPVLGTPHQ
jgi:diacylglycerol kinase family enzyme